MPGLDDYPCATKVAVKAPPVDELKLPTHWICANLSFWFNMPECIGCRSGGSGILPILCYCVETYAQSCNLIACDDIDSCCFSHGVGFCISLSQCREHGCSGAICSKQSAKCVCCFVCSCEFDGVLKMPSSCAKCFQQCCCCDFRCALPCDEDVPLACSCCGIWLKEPESMPTGWNGETGK